MTKINTKTIAFLGPEGSYTEIAADYFIRNLELESFEPSIFPSIIKVIEKIDNNSGNMGVVPIENSIEGIVRETVDSLIRTTSRVTIIQEIIVPISHCLIGKSTDISKIEKVTSITQALAQCQHFLAKNIPNAEIIQTTSTSEAVRQLISLPGNYAAIGSQKAAKIYDLNIIATQINDEADNKTRFVCLGSEIPAPTGNDKSSIAFSTCNQAGALVSVLNAFRDNDINLSYIESRPSKKVFGDYTFFMDFDGHIEDENVQKTLGKITPLISFYRFLGSYPKGNLISR